MGGPGATRVMVFTYGTLKTGFPNHPLIDDLASSGDAVFVASCQTSLHYPLVCGPYRVPFLINLPGAGAHRVSGELYSVSAAGLARLDALEGTERGHYQRLPIQVELQTDSDSDADAVPVAAEAYYAHGSYALKMWERVGRKSFPAYTHEVAWGYVRRADRPRHLTFLDFISSFVSSSS